MRIPFHPLRRVGVSAVVMAALAVGAPAVGAQTSFEGNINSCSDLGAGYVDGSAFVTSSHDGTYLDYTSSIAVVAVIKGGDNYNVYPAATSGTDLHAPDNGGGNVPTISHYLFCYVPTQSPTETPIPTATSTEAATSTPTETLVPTATETSSPTATLEAATETPTLEATVKGVTEEPEVTETLEPTEEIVDPTSTPEDEVQVEQLPDTGTGRGPGGTTLLGMLAGLVLVFSGLGWTLRSGVRRP